MLCACQPLRTPIHACIDFDRPARDVAQMPSAFPPSHRGEWTADANVGLAFASQNDLYRAISSWKRAEILLPHNESEERLHLLYDIFLANVIAQHYAEAIEIMETTPLGSVTATFPPHLDLATLLYASYVNTCNPTKAARVLGLIRHYNPERADRLQLWESLSQADICEAIDLATAQDNQAVLQQIAQYDLYAKSPGGAAFLNAIIPGMGYAYTGLYGSATTSFLLNALFIWAAVEFFDHHLYAAGIITAGIETGWYFGGIYGAGLAAKRYNEQLYDREIRPVLIEQRLFPIFQINYGF